MTLMHQEATIVTRAQMLKGLIKRGHYNSHSEAKKCPSIEDILIVFQLPTIPKKTPKNPQKL